MAYETIIIKLCISRTMPSDNLDKVPDHQVLSQPATPLTTGSSSLGSEKIAQHQADNLDIKRLYSWLAFLTSLSIILVAVSAGFAFWLKIQRDEMQRQLIEANRDKKIQVEQIDNLKIKINSLNSQVNSMNQGIGVLNKKVSQGLPNQIKGVQKDISSVKASVKKVATEAVTREQMAKTLQIIQSQKNLKR